MMAAYSRQAGSSGTDSASSSGPRTALLHVMIEVVFNPTNLWVSCRTSTRLQPAAARRQLPDPAAMWYDFHRDDTGAPSSRRRRPCSTSRAALPPPSTAVAAGVPRRRPFPDREADRAGDPVPGAGRATTKQEFNQVREFVQQLEGALAILERQGLRPDGRRRLHGGSADRQAAAALRVQGAADELRTSTPGARAQAPVLENTYHDAQG